MRRALRDQNGNIVYQSPIEDAPSYPITAEEFYSDHDKAAGGRVQEKSWQRALRQHRPISRATTKAARAKPTGSW